jgi:peroxiredoxin
MTIAAGDLLPDVELRTMTPDGPGTLRTSDALGKGKVVLFAVPGAFTPGCSNVHLPGFVQNAPELRAKGVGTIACVAVNDVFVLDAWSRTHGADDILMLSDGNAEFAEAMGLVQDGRGFGMGLRSKRYAAVLEDGVVRSIAVDEPGQVDLATCSNLMLKL